jgi:hypothetical protein
MQALFSLCGSVQQYLIPWIEESLGGLSAKEAEFVRVAEVAAVDSFMGKYAWQGNGRKPCHRKGILLAFIPKAVWNSPTTRALIDYLKASQNLMC